MRPDIEALERVVREHRARAIEAVEFAMCVRRLTRSLSILAGLSPEGTERAAGHADREALDDAIEEVLMWRSARAAHRRAMTEGADGSRLHAVECKHRGATRDEARGLWLCDLCGWELRDGGMGWVRP